MDRSHYLQNESSLCGRCTIDAYCCLGAGWRELLSSRFVKQCDLVKKAHVSFERVLFNSVLNQHTVQTWTFEWQGNGKDKDKAMLRRAKIAT